MSTCLVVITYILIVNHETKQTFIIKYFIINLNNSTNNLTHLIVMFIYYIQGY